MDGLTILPQNNRTTITIEDTALTEESILQIVNYLRFEMLAQRAAINNNYQTQIDEWADQATQNWWNQQANNFLKDVIQQ
jgi:hypothetical protein